MASAQFPEIAAEWHPQKNGNLTPADVSRGSKRKVWWQCSRDPTHVWQTTIHHRVILRRGCPVCSHGWTVPAIRGFIDALKQHLEHFTPAELYLLFQQNGMLQAQGKGRAFIDSLATGRFPFDEIEKFCLGESSLVDSFVANPQFTLESLDEQKHADGEEVLGVANESDVAELTLPIIETKDALASLQAAVAVSADQ